MKRSSYLLPIIVVQAIFHFSNTFASTQPLDRDCPIPEKGENWIPDDTRFYCIKNAHFLVGQPLNSDGEITLKRVMNGPQRNELRPQQHLGIAPNADIRCRFVHYDFGGRSKKFYCARLNGDNLYYPEKANKGESTDIIADADVLKVKYPDALPPSARQRESFTEVAVSRFFDLMGIPVDRMYPVSSVTCEGCRIDPHGLLQSEISSETNSFDFPSVERKFDGKRLEIKSYREADVKLGFMFQEIEWGYENEDQVRELEVLMLAAGVVVYHNTDANFQNRLTCPKGFLNDSGELTSGFDEKKGKCTYPIAMIQDLGSTFGTDGINTENPRGEHSAYVTRSVWKDARKCQTLTPFGEKNTVSEAGRRMFLSRLDKVLPYLRDILVLARFHLVDSNQVGTDTEKIDQWHSAMLDKILEIVFLKPASEVQEDERQVLLNLVNKGPGSLLEVITERGIQCDH